MTPGGWNETGYQADEVIVHVGGVAQGGGGGTHDGGDEAVGLLEGGGGVLEAVGADAVERLVVDDDGGVAVVGEPLERQDHVLGLHHHVRRVVLVREHGLRLHQLLGEVVAHVLQHERAQS